MILRQDTYEDLVEACRRYTRFHVGENLQRAWTGHGTRTSYKGSLRDGMMKLAHDYPPRVICWLQLTEQGAAIVQQWLDAGYDYKRIEAGDSPPYKVEIEQSM